MIKAVIFDLDGVLLDSRKANNEFYKSLLKKTGYCQPSEEVLSNVFSLTMMDTIKFLTKEKSEARINEIWKLGCKMRFPAKLLVMPKGMNESIKSLSSKYKLGIVTSRLRKGVRRFFRISKLSRYFDVVISPEDYSKPKPNPESLLIALDRLRIKPEEAVYIGDSLTDYEAAKNAGTGFIGFVSGSASKEDFKKLNVKSVTSLKDLMREFK
jgi:HAD superfamily hydrolase (TIGR01509 family)